MFLAGHTKELRRKLERDMEEAASEERFEDAAEVRGQLFALDHIQDVSLIKEDRGEDESSPRIEAYDTAHISGHQCHRRDDRHRPRRAGEEGLPHLPHPGHAMKNVKSREAKRLNDDIASLKELLARRLPHTEWPYPESYRRGRRQDA